MNKVLIPSAALLWGLQLAFLSPALALILVELYGATTAEVGWVLAIYNVSGFIASVLIPALADRRQDYLRPLLVCGALTVALAIVLAVVTTLPAATIALVVVGGPAAVGVSLLFAHLHHSGARPSEIVNTRALVSVAWVAGPPVATFIIGWFGNRAILLAIAVVAVLNVATTALMMARQRAVSRQGTVAEKAQPDKAASPLSRTGVVLVTTAFVALQATNATAMTIMTVYVTQTLGLDVIWAGIALGVAAGLEVPAMIIIGRLIDRHSHLGLIAVSCLAGIAYYVGLAFTTGPIMLVGLQVLSAWSFAGIAGVGLPLFQQMIPRPGLATGLYTNTRRVGAIVSGPIIAIGSLPLLGMRGIFVACAALSLIGLAIIALAGRVRAPQRATGRTAEA